MSAQSHRLRPRVSSAFALFAVSLVWLVSTTLCSFGMIKWPHAHSAANSDEHSHSHEGGEHHNDSGKSGQQPDHESSCCGSIQSAPAQSITSGLVLLAPSSSDHFWLLDTVHADAQLVGLFSAKVDYATGPPGVDSFAKHFLQRCLLSQAPPIVA